MQISVDSFIPLLSLQEVGCKMNQTLGRNSEHLPMEENSTKMERTEMKPRTKKKETSRSQHKRSRGSTASNTASQLEYLPKFAPTNGNITVKKAQLHGEKVEETGKILYSFSVTWTEDLDEARRAPLLNQPTERKMEKAPVQPKGEGIRCDGPCGKVLFGVQMSQFGDCDHNVCPNCSLNASTIQLFDGSPSCCNPECAKKSRESINPNNNSSVRSRSVSSNNSDAIEMVEMNIYFFSKDERGRSIRKTYAREISSQTLLEKLEPTLRRIIPSLDCCNVYYTVGQNANVLEMARLFAFDKCPVSQLVKGSAHLNIMVVAPGVPINKVHKSME